MADIYIETASGIWGKDGQDGMDLLEKARNGEPGRVKGFLHKRYIQATPGGNGQDAGKMQDGFNGENGAEGQDCPGLLLECRVFTVDRPISIWAVGGAGGNGGSGGRGGRGGAGGDAGEQLAAYINEYGPQKGGKGGRGGNGGDGGSGGNGGNGGSVTVRFGASRIPEPVTVQADGGIGGKPGPGGGCGPGGPGGVNGKDTGIDSNSAKPGFMGLFRKKRYIARPRMSSRAEGGSPGVCGSPGRPGNPGSPGRISVEQVAKDREKAE